MIKYGVSEMLEENRGSVVSGGEIGRKLGVSRTAVWKAVSQLKKEGYIINTIPNEGYCLDSESDMLSEQVIKDILKTSVIGNHIKLLKSVNSTNDYAKNEAQNGADEGLVVIADEQKSGKGRMGRHFFSPAGRNIYLTILLRPFMPASEINIITAAAAVAVVNALKKALDIEPSIKWVNDILFDDKKLCGILTEASVEAETGFASFVVVGIGINVNIEKGGFPPELRDKAISVFEILGKKAMRNTLIAEILSQFEKTYFLVKERKREEIAREYKKYLSTIGKDIRVTQGDISFNAKALDIDGQCRLIVKGEDGDIKTLSVGEVSSKGV